MRAAFRNIPGIGSQKLRRLIGYYGSARDAWQALQEKGLKYVDNLWLEGIAKFIRKIDPDAVAANLEKLNISLVIPGEQGYPSLLTELADAPPLLYYRGNLEPGKEALAIVGSRRATAYGKSASSYLAREVAARGVVVVSGLARGIDTAAHQGALNAHGKTWAFLGCGVDRIYPPENQKLAEAIMANGAVFSEFAPGTPPDAPHFPARNRLISGCARGVLVVEAGLKSGALITVDFALEQGREVFAVPGPIFSEMSRGTHQLLRLGAKVVEGIEDIWAEIGPWSSGDHNESEVRKVTASSWGSAPGNSSPKRGKGSGVNEEHQVLLELLSDVPIHIDRIVLSCPLPAATVALALLELELAGKIMELPGQHYVLAR